MTVVHPAKTSDEQIEAEGSDQTNYSEFETKDLIVQLRYEAKENDDLEPYIARLLRAVADRLAALASPKHEGESKSHSPASLPVRAASDVGAKLKELRELNRTRNSTPNWSDICWLIDCAEELEMRTNLSDQWRGRAKCIRTACSGGDGSEPGWIQANTLDACAGDLVAHGVETCAPQEPKPSKHEGDDLFAKVHVALQNLTTSAKTGHNLSQAISWADEALETTASARLTSAKTSGEWQPIETAPKDGTKIDLLYPYPRGRVINAEWADRLKIGWFWRTPTWEKGELLPESDWLTNTLPNMKPTHWMPVPVPLIGGQ